MKLTYCTVIINTVEKKEISISITHLSIFEQIGKYSPESHVNGQNFFNIISGQFICWIWIMHIFNSHHTAQVFNTFHPLMKGKYCHILLTRIKNKYVLQCSRQPVSLFVVCIKINSLSIKLSSQCRIHQLVF